MKRNSGINAIEVMVTLAVLGVVFAVVFAAVFPARKLNADLRNVMPRLEKEIYGLERDGVNSEKLELLKELKGLIGTQFKRTGFQTDMVPYESTGTLEDHLGFALRSLEREMDIDDPKGYNPGENKPALPPGSEKELKKLKRMKAVIELVLNG
ncbi:MAG: hypothetical protein ACE5FW_02970 [Candidatus Aenigmatarchaeota archaeon]